MTRADAATGWTIRAADPDDAEFLAEMLADAAEWRAGAPKPDVHADPDLARYIAGWGRPGDAGVIGVTAAGEPIGAAWLRHYTADDAAYGFVREDIPELAIAVHQNWRGSGIGRSLLRALEEAARDVGVAALSLSVDLDNPAIGLYRSEGYERFHTGANAETMLKRIAAGNGEVEAP